MQNLQTLNISQLKKEYVRRAILKTFDCDGTVPTKKVIFEEALMEACQDIFNNTEKNHEKRR